MPTKTNNDGNNNHALMQDLLRNVARYHQREREGAKKQKQKLCIERIRECDVLNFIFNQHKLDIDDIAVLYVLIEYSKGIAIRDPISSFLSCHSQ